jgi:serine/threonine protein kinase
MSASPVATQTPPNSAETFLKTLRQSQLLSEEVLAKWQMKPGLPDEPSKLAALLIKHGLLTNFQAKQLLGGRYRGFFLGSYKILDQLGQGGMGTVFIAEHTTLQRKVALKVLPVDKARDKIALERFYREARSAAALNHQHIVKLHDISQGAGVHFLVMEFVDGVTLQELIDKAGPMHYTQAVQIIAQVATGLQHAHDKGFVHRDIKPANIIQEKNGVVKILDMGLARSFDKPEDNLTAQLDADSVMGTVDYIAPEQALRKPADHRSDIYSLGATFFNLITGNTPFQGTTAQKLMGHQLTEVPKLSKLRGSVPPELNDIVARMMAKNPKDRYQSCGDLIDALARWIPSDNPNSIMKSGPINADDTRRQTSGKADKQATKKSMLKKKKKAAKEKKRKYILASIGTGIAAMVLLIVWMIWPSKKPEVAQRSVYPIQNNGNNTSRTNSNNASFKPIVTANFGDEKLPTMNFNFNLAHFQNNSMSWHLNSWREGDSGSAEWVEKQGKAGLQLKNVSGSSVQIFCDQLPGRAEKGQTYQVKMEYMTGPSSESFFILRMDNDTKREEKVNLPVQTSWTTVEHPIVIREACELFFYLQNAGGRPDNEIIIRNITISTAAPSTSGGTQVGSNKTLSPETVYSTEFGVFEPFQVTKQGLETTSGTAGDIQPFWYHCYQGGSKGEFTVKSVQGVRVFGMRCLEGEPTCQLGTLFNNALQNLTHGTKVIAVIEYQTDNDNEAIAMFQQNSGTYNSLASVQLTPSSTWRTVELPYNIDEKQTASFVINQTRSGGWIYIKSLTLKTVR